MDKKWSKTIYIFEKVNNSKAFRVGKSGLKNQNFFNIMNITNISFFELPFMHFFHFSFLVQGACIYLYRYTCTMHLI